MRIVVLAGPPCSGKTTMAEALAKPDDVVLDYDTIARTLGSPVQWLHPEPYQAEAEARMQLAIRDCYYSHSDGTAWVLRTAPRPHQRQALAEQWSAEVYLLDPGERECRRRAKAEGRPSDTGQHIGQWYARYRPWVGDRSALYLRQPIDRGLVEVDPGTV